MERNTYIDSIKTVLIFSVVLTHCLVRIGGGKIDEFIVMNFLYSFNMPLFVFISGYLFSAKKSWSKVLWGCFELFTAYCLFQGLWIALNHVAVTPRTIVVPQFSLWYLLSLVFWRIILKAFSCVSGNKYIWLVLSLAISLCCGFIPLGRELSFQRTFSFLPFFIIGSLCRGLDVLNYIRNMDKRISLLFIFLLIIVFYQIGKPPYWILCGRTSFYSYHVALVFSPIVKLCWYIFAIAGSVCILNLIPDHPSLAKYGNRTLTVYLLHFFPIWFLQKASFISDSLLLLMCLSFVIFFVLTYIHQYRIVRWLINPLSLCSKK